MGRKSHLAEKIAELGCVEYRVGNIVHSQSRIDWYVKLSSGPQFVHGEQFLGKNCKHCRFFCDDR